MPRIVIHREWMRIEQNWMLRLLDDLSFISMETEAKSTRVYQFMIQEQHQTEVFPTLKYIFMDLLVMAFQYCCISLKSIVFEGETQADAFI